MPKLCEFETCRSRATYGVNCNPIRCKQHKEENMKLSTTLCSCGNRVNYNITNLPPKFCFICKLSIVGFCCSFLKKINKLESEFQNVAGALQVETLAVILEEQKIRIDYYRKSPS
jgi:hypothetical protein